MKKSLLIALFLIASVLLSSLVLFGEEEDIITMTGKINEDEQIVTTKGEVFDLYDNAKSSELSLYKGQRIQVTGKVLEVDDNRAFMVLEFMLIKKPALNPDKLP
ncbi:MAG: hypothetical protein HQ517_07930 [SAR324 cluster bacterium]|nr:hypothetical protein [SAR324 cluster bacterium]